ncbi:MAG: IS110 family transposase, partial [Lactobacillaceae bacterium]|nr:IS110 family transposase [Lactobacillaceae bacterium]
MTNFIGMDISRDSAAVAIFEDQTLRKEFSISLDVIGFKELDNQVKSLDTPLFTFEATGVYSRRVETFMLSKGFQYQLLSPKVAHQRIAREIDDERFIKTDKSDARMLASSAKLKDYLNLYQSDPIYRELKDMSHRYNQLAEDLKREKNRAHRLLQIVFPTFQSRFSKTDSEWIWRIIAMFPHSSLVKTKDINELADIINSLTAKNLGKQSIAYAHKLWDAAHVSFPASPAASDNTQQMRELAQRILELIELKDKQIDKMAKLADNLEELDIYLSLPGVKINTAVRLIAELGDVRRFSTSRQLVAYAGLAVTIKESGKW